MRKHLEKEKPPEIYIKGGNPVDRNGVFKNPDAVGPTPKESEKLKEEFLTLINRIRDYEKLINGVKPNAK